MDKKTLMPAFIMNLAVFALECVGFVMSFIQEEWGFFVYYTQDSNLIAMAACGFMAVCELLAMPSKIKRIPRFATVFKYVSVSLVTVTFLVVLFVLAPSYGGGSAYSFMLFHGTMLYHHFLCPVLALISFLLFEKEGRIERRDTLFAIIPTLIYAIVTTALNILRVIEGPYPFLMVYEQPWWTSMIWFALIVGGAYGIATLIRLLSNRIYGGRGEKRAKNT